MYSKYRDKGLVILGFLNDQYEKEILHKSSRDIKFWY